MTDGGEEHILLYEFFPFGNQDSDMQIAAFPLLA